MLIFIKLYMLVITGGYVSEPGFPADFNEERVEPWEQRSPFYGLLGPCGPWACSEVTGDVGLKYQAHQPPEPVVSHGISMIIIWWLSSICHVICNMKEYGKNRLSCVGQCADPNHWSVATLHVPGTKVSGFRRGSGFSSKGWAWDLSWADPPAGDFSFGDINGFM